MQPMPVITLKSGLRVGNFSSPHPFNFTTGEVLPGCDPERTLALMLNPKEIEFRYRSSHGRTEWTDIILDFHMTEEVSAEISRASSNEEVDVVIVPLPVITACKATDRGIGKLRVCRVADRVAKTIYPDRFCV